MRNTEPVMVTRQYIMRHRTPRGAWTRVQIEALGLEWPPMQGWISDIEGVVISPQQAQQFESGKTINAKKARKQKPLNLDELVKTLQKHQDKLDHGQLAILAVILGNAKSRGR